MVDGRRSHPGPEFLDLLAAIHRFASRPKSHWDRDTLPHELIQIRQVSDLLELEFSEAAAAFCATDAYEVWGSSTTIDWIRHECKMSASAAVDRVCVGEQMATLPKSVEAVRANAIGFAHLGVIARTAEAIARARTGRVFDETELLERARQNSVGKLRHLSTHYRHAQDPDGLAADEATVAEERWLKLSPCDDGSLLISGGFDAAGGAALRTALEPLARPDGEADDRRRETRLADALVELATHCLDTGVVPRQGGQRPHLQVNTTLETLRGLLGSPAGELEFSLPISSKMVQRFACDSGVVRVLLGAESVVVDVGRARRVVSPATRRALLARDRGCRWPGCDRPGSWTSAHHLVHWAQGGETNLSNLILLCQRHHWRVHEGGWSLTLVGDQLVPIPSTVNLFPSARAPDVAAA